MDLSLLFRPFSKIYVLELFQYSRSRREDSHCPTITSIRPNLTDFVKSTHGCLFFNLNKCQTLFHPFSKRQSLEPLQIQNLDERIPTVQQLSQSSQILCFQEVHSFEADVRLQFQSWLPHWSFWISVCNHTHAYACATY